MPLEFVSNYYANQVDRILCPSRYVPVPYVNPYAPHVRVYRISDMDFVMDDDVFCVYVGDDFDFSCQPRFYCPKVWGEEDELY